MLCTTPKSHTCINYGVPPPRYKSPPPPIITAFFTVCLSGLTEILTKTKEEDMHAPLSIDDFHSDT